MKQKIKKKPTKGQYDTVLEDATVFDKVGQPLVVQCPVYRAKEQEVVDDEELGQLRNGDDKEHDGKDEEKVVALYEKNYNIFF